MKIVTLVRSPSSAPSLVHLRTKLLAFAPADLAGARTEMVAPFVSIGVMGDGF
jgi:hypothetical protein